MTIFSRSSPETVVMNITPHLAADMLATSRGNRCLRKHWVETLGRDMKSGNWILTNQAIGFTAAGILVDGHHRLAACIDSGVSFITNVSFGLHDSAYGVLDTGLRRTYSDRTGIDRRIMEVITFSSYMVNGYNRYGSLAVLAPYINSALKDAAALLIEHCPSSRKFFSSAPVKTAAVLQMINTGRDDYVRGQYFALVHQNYDLMSESAKVLCRQVHTQKTRSIIQDDAFCRAYIALDYKWKNRYRISLGTKEIKEIKDEARNIILSIIGESHETR